MDQVNLFIVGPTASGKTELAIALARAIDAEIISADSRQVYRDLDAGTAKPALENGRSDGVAYHLTDFLSPREPFDAGSFARLALEKAAGIRRRGKRVIVAGGTGLYVKALLEGLSPLPPRDPALRARLTAEAERHGRQALHERLRRVDPEAAAAIPANNIQRVVRALELHEISGKPATRLWREAPRTACLSGRNAVLSIDWTADALRERIERRSQAMWPAMLEEVRKLVPARYTGREPGFQSLGYKEAVEAVRGGLREDEGLARLSRATRLYAKRQRTWFRRQLESAFPITGADPGDMLKQALALIK